MIVTVTFRDISFAEAAKCFRNKTDLCNGDWMMWGRMRGKPVAIETPAMPQTALELGTFICGGPVYALAGRPRGSGGERCAAVCPHIVVLGD